MYHWWRLPQWDGKACCPDSHKHAGGMRNLTCMHEGPVPACQVAGQAASSSESRCPWQASRLVHGGHMFLSGKWAV